VSGKVIENNPVYDTMTVFWQLGRDNSLYKPVIVNIVDK